MNYEPIWKVLEELILEFSKRDITIPKELIEDLKTAQTYIKIYNTDPTALEIATQIEIYLEKVESNLLYLAGADISEEYANECMKRVYDARVEGARGKVTVPTKFVSGVPKEDHWIRLQVSDLLDASEVNTLLEQHNLMSKPQENGFLLVHGQKEKVKAFVKELGDKIRKKG